MSLLKLDRNDDSTLHEQIVDGISKLIYKKILLHGAKLPSIRSFASDHAISPYTVSGAFNKLVLTGFLESRPGAGFYAKLPKTYKKEEIKQTKSDPIKQAFDYIWFVRGQLKDEPGKLNASSGVSPNESLMDSRLISQSLKKLSTRKSSSLVKYGSAKGLNNLRQLIQLKLNDISIQSDLEQIILTQGATQAFDFIIRYMLKPGDSVLVDDPGYFNLFGNLKLHNIKAIGVPRTPSGPDINICAKLIKQYNPKLFFTQSVLHNPTGTSISPNCGFKLLNLASEHGITIIENDSYSDLATNNNTRLSTLDQLENVIYVSTFSKSVSSALRVGYIACDRKLAREFANIKVLSSITSSAVDEQLVYNALTDPSYRSMLHKFIQGTENNIHSMINQLESLNFDIFSKNAGGKFIWFKVPGVEDSVKISKLAAASNLIIAPGSVYRPDLTPTPWLRLNTAYHKHPELIKFLHSLT
ncbi:MAG: PLP-dependent aminotransferase family protein [Arenicella sp.]